MRDFVAHVLSPRAKIPAPLEPEQIAILTPYLQQKELLQSAFAKAKLQVWCLSDVCVEASVSSLFLTKFHDFFVFHVRFACQRWMDSKELRPI